MRKFILTILTIFLLLLPSSLFAGSCYYDGSGSSNGSAPWYVRDSDHAESANSAKQEDVYYCVNTVAAAGDTIYVGPGDLTWSTKYNHPENGNYTCLLPVTAGITLIGGTAGTTKITNGSDAGGTATIMVHLADYTTSQTMRISGFTFEANSRRIIHLGLGGDVGAQADFDTQTARIDNNIFMNSGTYQKGQAIWNGGTHWGVVDNNTFSDFNYPIANSFGVCDDSWWDNTPQSTFALGSVSYLYYEDNTFALVGASDNMLMNGEYSPRYVLRYNTITNTQPTYGLLDFHGEQATPMNAGFGVEIYGNQYTSSNKSCSFLKQRSGQSRVFYNNTTGVSSFYNTAYTSGACTCPSTHVADKVTHNSYWWGSREDLTGSLSGVSITGGLDSCNGLDDIPTEGRDVFTDGSSPGISCGSSLPGTCTEHAGYWYTTQSCSNLSNMVGVNPTTPISGTLYICGASNNWVSNYTPYTYPHPLREEGSGATTGTIIPGGCQENQVVTGGETIELTVGGTQWVAAGATFNAQRQNIIDGLSAPTSPANGWNNEWRDKEVVTAVVRATDYIVIITMSSQAAIGGTFNIPTNVDITGTIPGSAIIDTDDPVVCTPTFQISAEQIATESIGCIYDAMGGTAVYDATGPTVN